MEQHSRTLKQPASGMTTTALRKLVVSRSRESVLSHSMDAEYTLLHRDAEKTRDRARFFRRYRRIEYAKALFGG